MGKNHWRFYVV